MTLGRLDEFSRFHPKKSKSKKNIVIFFVVPHLFRTHRPLNSCSGSDETVRTPIFFKASLNEFIRR